MRARSGTVTMVGNDCGRICLMGTIAPKRRQYSPGLNTRPPAIMAFHYGAARCAARPRRRSADGDMEIADVKRRVVETIDGAKRRAADRRVRVDQATKTYDTFLNRIAVPMFRQIANVLKAESYPFNVYTPGSSVRLVSDRAPDDYIELALDTSGEEPAVSGH